MTSSRTVSIRNRCSIESRRRIRPACTRLRVITISEHIITARTEHKAVLDPCRRLEQEGFRVTYLTPHSDGLIDPAQVREAISLDTVLVSIMHANNEIGVLQDIETIARHCREREVPLHVDAAQSAGKIEIDLARSPVDLLSLTAHKLYGPKGIGALYVSPERRARLQPLMFGGGHERGLRSGTLAVHQIVGFGLDRKSVVAGK